MRYVTPNFKHFLMRPRTSMMCIVQFAPNTVQTVKLLKFFVRFDQILCLFFKAFSIWGTSIPTGAPPMDPMGLPFSKPPAFTAVSCVCPSIAYCFCLHCFRPPPSFKISGSATDQDLLYLNSLMKRIFFRIEERVHTSYSLRQMRSKKYQQNFRS